MNPRDIVSATAVMATVLVARGKPQPGCTERSHFETSILNIPSTTKTSCHLLAPKSRTTEASS